MQKRALRSAPHTLACKLFIVKICCFEIGRRAKILRLDVCGLGDAEGILNSWDRAAASDRCLFTSWRDGLERLYLHSLYTI